MLLCFVRYFAEESISLALNAKDFVTAIFVEVFPADVWIAAVTSF